MSEDTPKTSEVRQVDDGGFQANTGMSRSQASRATAAVLGVVGAALPDGLTPRQQLTAVINVIGMVASEVVAGTGGNEVQRTDLIISLQQFITKNANELAKQYEQAAQFRQFIEQSVAQDGKPVLEEGQKAN